MLSLSMHSPTSRPTQDASVASVMKDDSRSQSIKHPRRRLASVSALLVLPLLVSASAARHELRYPQEPGKPGVDTGQQGVDKKATVSALQTPVRPATTALRAFEQGQSELQARHYPQAAAWLERAIAVDGTQATYYLWLGRTYGYQAQHAPSGEQFFLARKVRKCLEKAVELNPDLVEARVDLIAFYLQAPSLLGGSVEKAKRQAAEIAKRDPEQGKLAWQHCQNAEQTGVPLFVLSSSGG
jgi:tetratricopeptide (TPR) repeat protein